MTKESQMAGEPDLLAPIVAESPSLVALRKDLHAHPELSFEELRTADLIAATLSSWGIPVHRGFAKTGLVGVIKHGTSGRSVALRADMDALPITEKNTFAHSSRQPGKMHACGHDGHMAMLMAAAKYLASHRNFDGTVYLIFQPAEEKGGGAREMMRDGLFERFPAEAVFGVHNWPGLPVGQFAVRPGPIFASSNDFKIIVRGKGTHAAMPQGGVDPVPIACQLVQAFQTIVTRNIRPIDAGIISVTCVGAGEATNVIPDACELRGTVRTFSIEVLDLIERRMREISTGICQALGARCEFEFRRNYPPLINHPQETRFVRSVLESLVGSHNVREFDPTMGAEDFSYFLLDRPGCYFLIGNGEGEHFGDGRGPGTCTLHSPYYDFNDKSIPLGGSAWVRLVEAWFRQA